MIDSHCHLADTVFAADLDAVIARAQAAGLERVLVILEGANAAEAAQADRIIGQWSDVRVAVGVHPHMAHQFSSDPAAATEAVRQQIANTPSARAVG
jgi:TatD DNase family protein